VIAFVTEVEAETTTEYVLSPDVKLADEHIEQVKAAMGGASVSNVVGKKLGVVGDSITVGYMVTGYNDDGTAKGGYVTKKWYDYVVERYGFASVQANAEIGRSFAKDGSMSTRFTQRIKELDSDLDVIIVFGGTNDLNFSPAIGTMDDVPSEANGGISFFSALRFTAEYLLTNHPNARIIFMTPLPRNDTTKGFNYKDPNGKRLIDYADAIAEMCRCYGFDIVDLNRVGGFYVWSDTWLTANMLDGLHPNEAGTEIYARNGILPKLDTIFFDN
jgi:lysophospholipase L1-like esterase